MNKVFWLLLLTGVARGQSVHKPIDHQPFSSLIDYFRTAFYGSDQIKPPLIYEPKAGDYKSIRVMLSDSALNLQTAVRLVNVSVEGSPFPRSYSIIYRNHLVSLFDPGQFVCLRLGKLERDPAYEKKLNTKRFEYHWLLGGRLVGLSKNTYYYFDDRTGWRRYTTPAPLTKQPKLYEDDRFVAFSTCRGEFGGTLFFYDKQTRLTRFMPAVCATAVMRQADGYYALASLGHGMGSADLSFIQDPARLPIFKRTKKYGESEADSSRLAGTVLPTTLFDYYGLQLFGGFLWKQKRTYVANWGRRTFLAEVADSTLFIRHPLFNTDIYTHNPVTTAYGPETILINLDFYGLAREREVAYILINQNKITRIEWNLWAKQ